MSDMTQSASRHACMQACQTCQFKLIEPRRTVDRQPPDGLASTGRVRISLCLLHCPSFVEHPNELGLGQQSYAPDRVLSRCPLHLPGTPLTVEHPDQCTDAGRQAIATHPAVHLAIAYGATDTRYIDRATINIDTHVDTAIWRHDMLSGKHLDSAHARVAHMRHIPQAWAQAAHMLYVQAWDQRNVFIEKARKILYSFGA